MKRKTLLLGLVFLFGCSDVMELQKREVFFPIVPAKEEALSEGSLWRDEGRGFLFSDRKARRVGDTVTVKILESSLATQAAKTESSRSSSVDAGINSLFNAPVHFGLKNIWPGGFRPEIKSKMETDFKGEGTTSRSSKIIATLTCHVVAVLPNGNLLIEGQREIFINREREYIRLRGIVRPEDIGPDNTVLSTLLADARIEYGGKGIVSDKQGTGFLGGLLDLLWPF
jgi:flagellar L-ring protein precursor FlgH